MVNPETTLQTASPARDSRTPLPPSLPQPPFAASTSSGAALAQVPSVGRALALLDRLAERREPMSMARLAAELALPKSSVHGLCSTLMSYGYLKRQPDGAFLIGPRVMSLAEAFVSGIDVAQEFNALWSDSHTGPEETVVMSVLSGSDSLYVAVRHGARPLGLAFNVGMRLPACLCGSGRAMLAAHDDASLRRLYADGLTAPMTRRGPRTVDGLLRELAVIRRRGYSIDDEAVREGVCSFGAAVVNAAGEAVAGVAVCINKALLGADRGERHRLAALTVARTLSLRLGGTPPADPPRPMTAGAGRKPRGAKG